MLGKPWSSCIKLAVGCNLIKCCWGSPWFWAQYGTHTHTRAHTQTHTHTQPRTHTHTHTRMHTHTASHTHTNDYHTFNVNIVLVDVISVQFKNEGKELFVFVLSIFGEPFKMQPKLWMVVIWLCHNLDKQTNKMLCALLDHINMIVRGLNVLMCVCKSGLTGIYYIQWDAFNWFRSLEYHRLIRFLSLFISFVN